MKNTVLHYVIAVVIVLVTSAMLFAEENEQSNFIDQLVSELESEGWSSEEIEELKEDLSGLSWEEAGSASAEVVALALSYFKEAGAEVIGLECAQLALELAYNTIAMDEAGLEERKIAMAALEGTRNMLGEIEDYRETGNSEELGQIIRNRVREAVMARVKAQIGEHASERARKVLSERFGDDFPPGPGVGRTDNPGPPQP